MSPLPGAVRDQQSWKSWTCLFGLAALFLLLRWNNFNAPLTRDESEYAYAAQTLKAGGAPYQDAFIQKPPMVVYSYWLADSLLPGQFWAPRVLSALFVAGAAALLGLIARREFGGGSAMSAMWFVTPMVFLPNMEQFTANTEEFLLLPLLGVFAIHVWGRGHPPAPRLWFAAGFLAATTLLYKYTALPLLFWVFGVWLFETWRQRAGVKSTVQCVGALVGGGFLAAMLELGFFLHRDGGAALWDCTVTFNRHYLASNNFGWLGVQDKWNTFLHSWWILLLLVAAAFMKVTPRLWFWCGALVCAGLATGGSTGGHYYILLTPFWALLAAAGVQALADFLSRRSTFTIGQARAALTSLTLVLLLLSDASWLSLPPKTFAAAKFARHSVFVESPIVGRRVAELSSPADPVWVAASEPQILCYAHRPSATRFITVYALVIPSPEQEAYQTQAIGEISAHPPKLIVWAHSWLQEEPHPSRYLQFLNDTLDRDYERVGGCVLTGNASRWAEPLADADVPAASIVLFRRKTSR